MLGILLIATISISAIAAESETSFTCDFEKDTCGFTNQEGLKAQWERKELDIGSMKKYMMVAEPNDTSVQLAKMMTPYFELEEEMPGCLSFDLYVNGVKNFAVLQERDFGIISIWTRTGGSAISRPRIDVDIDESTRFFFEAVLDGSVESSQAAIGDAELKLRKKC